jgi:outer membrane protein TolC
MMRKLTLLAISLCSFFAIHGQRSLSIYEAVELGLERNAGVSRQETETEIASARNDNGAAGKLPSLSFNSGGNYSLSYSNIEFLNGETQEVSGASNFAWNTGIQLDYALFEGGAKDLRAKVLDQDEAFSQYVLRDVQRSLTADIAIAYSNVSYRLRRQEIREEYREFLEEFLRLEEQKKSLGKVSSLEVLQAETDLQQALADLEAENLFLVNGRTRLNRLMYIEDTVFFDIDTTFIQIRRQDGDSLEQVSMQLNPNIQAANLNAEIAQANLDLISTQRYPTIGSYAGLYHNYSRSGAGFLVSNQGFSPEIGVSINYNIYDGKRVRREEEVARLEIDKALKSIEEERQFLKRDIELSIENYDALVLQLQYAHNQEVTTKRQMQLSEQMYNAGRITIFDYRQVRQQWLDAQIKALDIEYLLVIEYIRLKLLSGLPII